MSRARRLRSSRARARGGGDARLRRWLGLAGGAALALAALGAALASSDAFACRIVTTGLAHDECVAERIHDDTSLAPEQVMELAVGIEDQTVRAAAVESWVRRVRGTVPLPTTLEACNLLDEFEEMRCEQRASAVHLR